jgi:hypothetical protein
VSCCQFEDDPRPIGDLLFDSPALAACSLIRRLRFHSERVAPLIRR